MLLETNNSQKPRLFQFLPIFQNHRARILTYSAYPLCNGPALTFLTITIIAKQPWKWLFCYKCNSQKCQSKVVEGFYGTCEKLASGSTNIASLFWVDQELRVTQISTTQEQQVIKENQKMGFSQTLLHTYTQLQLRFPSHTLCSQQKESWFYLHWFRSDSPTKVKNAYYIVTCHLMFFIWLFFGFLMWAFHAI